MLLVELEDKYNESGLSFSEFLDGYWSDRMAGVMSEEAPIDHNPMENLWIVLQVIDDASSRSSKGGDE